MNENNGKFFARYDGAETYNIGPFDNLEDARQAGLNEWLLEHRDESPSGTAPDGLIIEVGVLTGFTPSIDARDVIEQNAERAEEDCGEVAEGWPGKMTAEQRDRLTDALTLVLSGFLHEIGEYPTFGTFGTIESPVRWEYVAAAKSWINRSEIDAQPA